jgi:hypothetical protein
MDEPLVVVETFATRMEAEIARGALDAAGIEAFIHTDDAGGLRPDLALRAGVDLVVRESEVAQAAEVLGGVNSLPDGGEPGGGEDG